MGSPTKSQRKRLRRQRQAKRVKATLNSSNGVPQARPQQNFYDLVAEAQTKALKPYIGEQVKILGQAIARNVIQITANYNLRLNVLETLAINKGLVADKETLLDLYTNEEDVALGLTKSNEAAEAGDYVRFTALDTKTPETKVQYLSVEKLANKPYEANADAEEAMIGMLPGQKKLVDCKMPGDKTFTFEITVSRVSKRAKAETTPNTAV